MEGRSTAFKILTCKPTGMRLKGRSRCRWEYNIRIDLEEIDVNSRNSIWLRTGIIGGLFLMSLNL